MTPIAKAPNPDRAVTGPAVADIVQRLRDKNRGWHPDQADAADEIERLRAQVAELEKDAKRYRWLRNQPRKLPAGQREGPPRAFRVHGRISRVCATSPDRAEGRSRRTDAPVHRSRRNHAGHQQQDGSKWREVVCAAEGCSMKQLASKVQIKYSKGGK